MRALIAEENFTPEELCIPSTFDVISVCSALRSFPIKINATKLIVIIALASLNLTQQDLLTITNADSSNLSHILSDLREQCLIERVAATPYHASTFKLTPQGIQLCQLFVEHYFRTVENLNKIALRSHC